MRSVCGTTPQFHRPLPTFVKCVVISRLARYSIEQGRWPNFRVSIGSQVSPFKPSAMYDEETQQIVQRFRNGDSRAANEIFSRYVDRLVGIARGRLSAKLGRRVDPEDIVQSAYRSFFSHVRKGEYALASSGELWRLLVAITLNKLRGQVEFHTAAKRALSAEQSSQANPNLPAAELAAISREPTPDEAAELVEQINLLMVGLDESQRRMLEMRLQGYQIEEIATEVGRSERGVRRLLDKIKQQLQPSREDVSLLSSLASLKTTTPESAS